MRPALLQERKKPSLPWSPGVTSTWGMCLDPDLPHRGQLNKSLPTRDLGVRPPKRGTEHSPVPRAATETERGLAAAPALPSTVAGPLARYRFPLDVPLLRAKEEAGEGL